ncbi:ras GEF [Cadophora sp. DSE1049]|nr:ras GEF [Cadophora sp. DSE1049]
MHVAPLSIRKVLRGSDAGIYETNTPTQRSSQADGSHSQITPPAIPSSLQPDLQTGPSVFHNFLRAICPFHPACAISDTTVKLPLNKGDVILVHSIDTNGWADGTLLVSGARGWLPTNYCEAYNPGPMEKLLRALLHFLNLLQGILTSNKRVLANQEITPGIFAGVRYLLGKSHCLTRESTIAQTNKSLRRHRKALLSDLPALSKTAERLQQYTGGQTSSQTHADDVNDIIHETMQWAFRIVIKSVRFHDVFEEGLRLRQSAHKVMVTVVEGAYNHSTLRADSASLERTQATGHACAAISRRSPSHSSAGCVCSKRQSLSPVPSTYSSPAPSSRPMPMKRLSSVQEVSHRLSFAAPTPSAQYRNLVSKRLDSSHDTFLSHLASFIGGLHLQSPYSIDRLLTIRQSVNALGELFVVVEAVCAHDNQSAESLKVARNSMDDRIIKLLLAARDIVKSSEVEDDGVVIPQQNDLLMAATGCVKAAGECVAKAKYIIEQIGDIELEPQDEGLGINAAPTKLGAEFKPAQMQAEVILEEPMSRTSPPPLVIPSHEKPLPEAPGSPPFEESTIRLSTRTLEPVYVSADSTTSDSKLTSTSLFPPLPEMMLTQQSYIPSDYSLSHDSTRNTRSQTSTRATIPDHAPANQPVFSEFSAAGDSDDGESKIPQKTYAHELLHNKESQIIGGTLPALVEKLTPHESTPNSMFVLTFYLTFRLFTTPVDLAKALVDRFDYIAESPHIARPVQLRIYNVFKHWLGLHWESSDHEALSVIKPFTEEKLLKVFSDAGKRLSELVERVSSTDGPLIPRQVPSMGKTPPSIAEHIPTVVPLLPSNLTRNAWENYEMGGTNPTILDFDPLDFARQLTIMEMNIFCSIIPRELLRWTKGPGSTAMSVRAMSTLSTDLSNFVADTIVQHDDAMERAVIISHWIMIAHKCLELNNYNSLMVIIFSFNHCSIGRLKKTWNIVSQKREAMLKDLQAISKPDRNFAVLRDRLRNLVPPCLPFIEIYLKDLFFIGDNPATKQLPGIGENEGKQVINFDKHIQTAKTMGELQRFQAPYCLTEVPELQEWIQAQMFRVNSLLEHDRDYLYRKSLRLEPRQTS